MKNPYLVEFLEILKSRYSIDSINMSVSEWVAKNTKLGGKPFDYSRYPFQREIVDDMHKDLTVMKLSQVGLSEVQIRKMCAFLYRNQGTTGLFSLPNKLLRDAFSDMRVKKVLDDSTLFNSPDFGAQTRRVELKQIGKSYLVLPNATEAAATSLSVDFLMVDEVDLTDQEILGLYGSRLQNSDWAIRQDFSTPTFADFGIDASYQSTDQREYLCKCPSCNHWQVPLFARSHVIIPGLQDSINFEDITEEMEPGLDLMNARVICEKCGNDLDLRNPELRQWVSQKPHIQSRRGYRVRPFSTDRITVAYIIAQLFRYKKKNFMRGWYNTVLGECYNNASIRLQIEDINACMGSPHEIEASKTRGIFVGIDVGLVCHVTIGDFPSANNVRVLKMLPVPAAGIVQFVTELRKTHRIICGAMDRYPYTPTADAVFEASGGTIYPVGYTQGKNINHKQVPESGENYVEGNRTWMIDLVQKAVKGRYISFNGYGPMADILKDHLQAMVRNEEPEKQAVWIKLDKEDHFFHSLAFLLFSYKLAEYFNQVLLKDADQRTAFSVGAVAMPMAGNDKMLSYSKTSRLGRL